MSKPLLHLGDVGLMIEGIGGGCRPQGMCADFKTKLCRLSARQLIDAVWCDRLVELPRGVVADRPEQGAAVVFAVAGGDEVFMNERMRAGMQRQITPLAAYAGHAEMRHAFARVPEILDLELAQFFAPQRMEKQRRKNVSVVR